jgi:hypothetical protein
MDQLICDGKTLRGSGIDKKNCKHRFAAEVTIYAGALVVAQAQTTYGTNDSSEKQGLKELLNTLDVNGVRIQTDGLHKTQTFVDVTWVSRPSSC